MNIKIRNQIKKGNTEEAVAILESCINNINSELGDEITLLIGRYKLLQKNYNINTISEMEKSLELSKINRIILDIAKKINVNIRKKHVINNELRKKSQTASLTEIDKALKTLNSTYNFIENINITDANIYESLLIHKKEVKNWCDFVYFKDSQSSKLTNQIYVDLEYYLVPKKIHINKEERKKTTTLLNIFKKNPFHIVILGAPGAGKSTTMKKITDKILKGEFISDKKYNIPIVIRLRDLNKEKILSQGNSLLIKRIMAVLGVVYESNSLVDEVIKGIVTKKMIQLIDNLGLVIILDGFDELKTDYKYLCINEINELVLNLNNSKIILTSRTGEFPYKIPKTEEFEIKSLTKKQIKQFIDKWLNNKEKSLDLHNQIKKSPFADTAIRPLNLAHLCAIYERNLVIPEKPKTVYRKIINLLLEEWDLQRGIKRISNYSKFEIDRKYEFLSTLAYILTVKFEKSIFTTSDLDYAYDRMHLNFGLPKKDKRAVVSELETHNGIFIQSAYNQFEFSHKSIQEALTAEYLLKLPKLPNFKVLQKIPHELAILISMSSNPTDYLAQIILEEFRSFTIDKVFYSSFLQRLLIEKPDFNHSPTFSLTVMYLYTKYRIEYGSKEILEELVKLTKLNSFGISLKRLLRFYKPTKQIKSTKTSFTIPKMYPYKTTSLSFDSFALIDKNYSVYQLIEQNRLEIEGISVIPEVLIIHKEILS